MHKLAKGLKKKKKQKKGKKGAEEEEFDPEELERYRRERAEAQQKAAEENQRGESGQSGAGEAGASSNAGSDEWRKFEALTAGVDSILKKTQGDLDRIKSTSFFQRKPPLVEDKKPEKPEDKANGSAKEKGKPGKWIGFDEEGNPVERDPGILGDSAKEEKPLVGEDGIVYVPEDEDEHEDSADEDIFDTTYVDVLQNIDVQLAYIPESPTQEELGDDPFDTTNADKVLKTVDKKGNKLVSLGNAVEVLAGRIDHVSTCKLSATGKGKRPRVQQDLLLDNFEEIPDKSSGDKVESSEPVTVEKTLLDDDDDLPDIPVDLTSLPPIQNLPRPVTPSAESNNDKLTNGTLDISEFESITKERTILEEIPDLDEAEFDLEASTNEETIRLDEAEDPFAEKDPAPNANNLDFQADIIEASFEAATFVNEEDPFDTSFAENILPGKTELKFIEKELEDLPVSEVTISLTDPAGLNRNYETGLLQSHEVVENPLKKDLLGGSSTDLSQLVDQPINPLEEITYVDPFDTSTIQEPPPGKAELKVLEKELLGEEDKQDKQDFIDDDDFDPRKDDPCPATQPTFAIQVNEGQVEENEEDIGKVARGRKPSRPEALPIETSLLVNKTVAFDLPTPSNRPDLLITSEEEKSLHSKPLTPYYTQKSIEEVLPAVENEEEVEVDPFDTSFVSKLAPGKTELKLIESELLSKEETVVAENLSDEDFDPRAGSESVKIPEEKEAIKSEENVLSRQETLLDAEVEVDAKPLTPRIESKSFVSEEIEEISYADPFDTSIATNILPGKAELRILEKELESIVEPPPLTKQPEILLKTSVVASNLGTVVLEEDDDFDPRAEEKTEKKDFLSLEGEDPGDKVLTPIQNIDELTASEDIDPFDTSFAVIGPGKTELKLLESELMEN